MVELELVVVAGTSASEAARGGDLKAQASVKQSPTYRRGAASHCSHGWRVQAAPQTPVP